LRHRVCNGRSRGRYQAGTEDFGDRVRPLRRTCGDALLRGLSRDADVDRTHARPGAALLRRGAERLGACALALLADPQAGTRGLKSAPPPVAIAADLTRPEEAERMAATAEENVGPVPILVNSAGAARRYAPADLDAAAWRDAMDAKFFSYIHAIDAVLKRMLD